MHINITSGYKTLGVAGEGMYWEVGKAGGETMREKRETFVKLQTIVGEKQNKTK